MTELGKGESQKTSEYFAEAEHYPSPVRHLSFVRLLIHLCKYAIIDPNYSTRIVGQFY